MNPAEKTARDIKDFSKRIYTPRHEYGAVEAQAFRHLDLNFYDRVRESLVAKGCIWLGDVENVSLKNTANDFRTFIRLLVSDDHTICIGLFHPKPKFWMRLLIWILRIKIGRTVDCESELSNGEFIVTSNGETAAKLTPPPGFHMQFFPVSTDHETLFQTHRQRLNEYLAANPGVHAIAMRTSTEALDMQHRMQFAKAAYRQKIGYVSEAELQNMGADPENAAEIKQAMDRPDNER